MLLKVKVDLQRVAALHISPKKPLTTEIPLPPPKKKPLTTQFPPEGSEVGGDQHTDSLLSTRPVHELWRAQASRGSDRQLAVL